MKRTHSLNPEGCEMSFISLHNETNSQFLHGPSLLQVARVDHSLPTHLRHLLFLFTSTECLLARRTKISFESLAWMRGTYQDE
jgi:hypothetical protein